MRAATTCLLTLALLFSTGMNIHAQQADYLKISSDWLYAIRLGEPADSLRALLAGADESVLRAALSDDDKRKAFWINVYNAVTQATLKADPARYKKRSKFFKAKLANIAGQRLSLDDIEHGILRRSKAKLSLGYFNSLFKSRFEKALRVDRLDPRIHFALNCGARSCPPVAYYEADKINEQLQGAMDGHLKAETDFDSTANRAAVTAFMGWFRADFGGKRGIRKLLRNAGAIPAGASPRIAFKKYDWNLYLDNFKEE